MGKNSQIFQQNNIIGENGRFSQTGTHIPYNCRTFWLLSFDIIACKRWSMSVLHCEKDISGEATDDSSLESVMTWL